jgi:hypothetical protein
MYMYSTLNCKRIYEKVPNTHQWVSCSCSAKPHRKRQDSLSLSLSFKLRIVEVRSAAIFLSAQAQFRSQLTAD